MAFTDHKYPDLLNTFGLTERIVLNLFADIPPVPASDLFRSRLDTNTTLALTINTEMARANWLIAPLLGELWTRYEGAVSLHSGTLFPADPDAGLIGYCDFLIGRGPQREQVSAPVIVVAEAKNQNTHEGLGQCIAGMVGALRFNRRHGAARETVYGCSTTGTNWKFLRLTGSDLAVDMHEYLMPDADRILGILTHMLGPLPVPAAA